MLDCLINLVGLTDRDCDCFSGSEPSGFSELNESETGYYLTDGDYGLPLLDSIYAGIDCGDPNNIFSVLIAARGSSINAINTDLQAAMLLTHDRVINPFSGLVGQRRATSSRTATGSIVGQIWQPVGVKDAFFRVSHIWVGVSTTGTITLTISSNDPDFDTVTQEVEITTAGAFQKFALTTPVDLPLYSVNTDDQCGLRYAISYQPETGMKPLNNVYSCCGNRNTEWRQFITAGGFETNDLGELLDTCTYSASGNAMGLAVEGFLSCNNLQWLCELEELNGLDLRDVLARAIQYRSTVYLVQHILDSTNINYWTTLNREALYGKRNHAQKRFDELIMWIAENLPSNATGCYKCKPSRIQRRSF